MSITINNNMDIFEIAKYIATEEGKEIIKSITTRDSILKFKNYPVRVDQASKSLCGQFITGLATAFTEDGVHSFDFSIDLDASLIYIDKFDEDIIGKLVIEKLRSKIKVIFSIS